MGLLSNLLSTGGYVLYNREIARSLGAEVAILLGTLCFYQQQYGGEEFYCQQARIIEDTALTEYAVKRSMQRLIELGVVAVEKKGMPAKNFYRLDEARIVEVMRWNLSSGVEFDPTSQVTSPVGVFSHPQVGSNSHPQTTNKTIREVCILDSGVGGEVSSGTKGSSTTRARAKFSPPTVEEVTAYCEERRNRVDPQAWHDFYTSKGWLVGKTPMKDWKAAVRTWERSSFGTSPQPKRLESNDDYFKYNR